ncbi:extensin family protein [Sphingomonas sp.]|uniref:extensin-like domain-containing protein n=1 Tax=Sphingomonas sp. TaxID=28214 RepID=UPI001AFCF1CF|nr:extensin family protein [Sphingomonas sp.]MBO9714514.1 extensin family protein [Sphingomonas sp.]
MRLARRLILAAFGLLLLAAAALLALAELSDRPQDLPWTDLDLRQPPGWFTRSKLVALQHDYPRCQHLLRVIDAGFAPVAAIRPAEHCGYADGGRLALGGTSRAGFAPNAPILACPLAAAVAVWERDVVQRAALAHLGRRVARIEHLGSYNCRRLYGQKTGMWSEHASANALDVAAFRLADGTRISLLDDWKGEGGKAEFLREVRDGGCRIFATTLSPDYNAAHRNHLHLDMGEWGRFGFRFCK